MALLQGVKIAGSRSGGTALISIIAALVDLGQKMPLQHDDLEPFAIPIMQYFKYKHLTNDDLIEVSSMICNVAEWMDIHIPDSAEKSAGLRKLLEAKTVSWGGPVMPLQSKAIYLLGVA